MARHLRYAVLGPPTAGTRKVKTKVLSRHFTVEAAENAAKRVLRKKARRGETVRSWRVGLYGGKNPVRVVWLHDARGNERLGLSIVWIED